MSKRQPTREELEGYKRAELQALAKENKIPANIKSQDIINKLLPLLIIPVTPSQSNKSGSTFDGPEWQQSQESQTTTTSTTSNPSPQAKMGPPATVPKPHKKKLELSSSDEGTKSATASAVDGSTGSISPTAIRMPPVNPLETPKSKANVVKASSFVTPTDSESQGKESQEQKSSLIRRTTMGDIQNLSGIYPSSSSSSQRTGRENSFYERRIQKLETAVAVMLESSRSDIRVSAEPGEPNQQSDQGSPNADVQRLRSSRDMFKKLYLEGVQREKEMKAEMKEMRAEMRAEIRAEMKALREEMKAMKKSQLRLESSSSSEAGHSYGANARQVDPDEKQQLVLGSATPQGLMFGLVPYPGTLAPSAELGTKNTKAKRSAPVAESQSPIRSRKRTHSRADESVFLGDSSGYIADAQVEELGSSQETQPTEEQRSQEQKAAEPKPEPGPSEPTKRRRTNSEGDSTPTRESVRGTPVRDMAPPVPATPRTTRKSKRPEAPFPIEGAPEVTAPLDALEASLVDQPRPSPRRTPKVIVAKSAKSAKRAQPVAQLTQLTPISALLAQPDLAFPPFHIPGAAPTPNPSPLRPVPAVAQRKEEKKTATAGDLEEEEDVELSLSMINGAEIFGSTPPRPPTFEGGVIPPLKFDDVGTPSMSPNRKKTAPRSSTPASLRLYEEESQVMDPPTTRFGTEWDSVKKAKYVD